MTHGPILESLRWRWYRNDAATPTDDIAAENTTGVLADGDNQAVIRLRIQFAEINDDPGSGTVLLQMSGDGTNWFDATAGSGEMHARVTDGAGTNDTTIASNLLTSTNTSGKYHEAQNVSETVAASESAQEIDFAINTQMIATGHTYTFRLEFDGTAVSAQSGFSLPTLTGTAVGSKSNAVSLFSLTTAGGEPEIWNYGANKRCFHDGARWWVFYLTTVSDTTTIRYKSSTDAVTWTSESTVTFTNINDPRSFGVVFREISSTKYVLLACMATDNVTVRMKRGTISGSTITWDGTERTAAIVPSGSGKIDGHPALDIDDGNYVWIGGACDVSGSQAFAARSTNTLDNATYYTFNATKTASSVAPGVVELCEVVGLASSECLIFWTDATGQDLKSAKVTESGGVGTVVTVNSTTDAHDVEWGVARGDDGNVYCVHSSTWGSGSGALNLRVYSESGDSWANGTSPSWTKDGTSNDGIRCVWGADGKLYAFATMVNGEGANNTQIDYQAYTGGTSGTWDAGRTSIAGPNKGNIDQISSSTTGDGGKIVLFAERGDDNTAGTPWELQSWPIDAAAAVTFLPYRRRYPTTVRM